MVNISSLEWGSASQKSDGEGSGGWLGRETFRRFTLLATTTTLVWAGLWLAAPAPLLSGVVLATAGVLGASYALHRAIGLRRAAHLSVGASVAVVFAVVAGTGGVESVQMVWLFLLPLVAMLLLEVRGALGWGVVVVAGVLGLWLLELRGVSFPLLAPADRLEALRPLVHSSALVVLLLLSLIYARLRESTLRETRSANRRLEVLNAVARILVSERSPGAIYRALCAEVGKVLRRDAFLVALWDGAAGVVRYPLLYEGGREHPGEDDRLGEGPVSRAIRERRTVFLPEGSRGTGGTWGDGARRARAAIYTPMVRDGRVLGVLGVQSYGAPYSAEDVRLFEALADEAAVAVENARLHAEQVESQRRLLQSAKLASIGELVAGVAHELNNPLTVVKSTAHLLEMDLEGEAAEDARIIREHADRAARIVRSLLRFARQAPQERAEVELNEVVERVCRFREAGMASEGVRLEVRPAPDPLRTVADASQLEQVLLNLLNNAAQAIASGRGSGEVTVETAADGEVLCIRVADDGPGIAEEHLPRIFDPFFTTREVGEGTGLGLSVSHGIVADHGGAIRVESERGRGTVFTVEIPWVQLPRGGAPEGAAAAPPAPPRRVLLVDDEPELRRVLRRFLEERGHGVEEAGSGEEALSRLERGSFDAVVLDLRMPGLPGDGVYRELLQRSPELAARVVFATGDVISPARREFLKGTGRPVFEKPYDLEALAREVEGVRAAFVPG